MLELRADDLRFTSDEVRAFFRRSIGVDVDPESLTILEQRTEGWIVGLQLVGLSLRDAGELAALMKGIEGTDRHVMDYLLAEVLSRQPKVTQEVLLRTSILGRFCAPLLDDLLDCEKPAGGYQEALQQMEQANLFLVPLDHERAWYRYHHLFRELLQHKLRSESGAELVASLHARASAWFASEGLIEEALTHALAAGDPRSAAKLVERHRHALLDREDWRTLVDWLEMLPQELVQQRPALLLVRAWRQQWLWQYAGMPAILQEAEELIARDAGDLTEPENQVMRGEIDLLQSALWFARGDGRRCVECAERALERIPRSLVYARGLLFEYLGFGHQISGQAETGIRILEEAFVSDDAKEDLFAARVLLGLGVIHYLSGHLQLQEQVAQQILRPGTGKGLSLSAPWAYWLLGTARYQQNSLAEAATLFSAVTEHRYLANARTSHECLLNLALTYQAQGRPKVASEVVEIALQFALETRHPIHLLEVRSFQARLALLQGDLEAALRWARGVKAEDLPARLPWTEVPRLTLAKVLIAEGMRDSLRQASQILDEVLGVAQDMHAGRLIIEVLALQALVCDAQGEVRKALDLIRQALDLAQPDGFIRIFVDLGPAMARLLYRVAELEKEPGRVGQFTVAFSPSSPAGRATQRSDQIAQPQTVEPLTTREREILELLARRLSDKEIARVLTISPHTVSKHVGNLCAKLQVAGRRQAVSRARVLGILSP